MPTDQAEVVSEYMSVKFVAELSAQCTTTGASDKGTEDDAGHSSERDTEWTGHGANSSTSLAACQRSTDATSGTATVPMAAAIFMAWWKEAILGE